MTKAEIISLIAEKTGIEKSDVSTVVEAFFKTIKSSMSSGEPIFIRGFGTFENKLRAPKTARNISKNTAIIIPAHYKPAFKPCKEFCEEVSKLAVTK